MGECRPLGSLQGWRYCSPPRGCCGHAVGLNGATRRGRSLADPPRPSTTSRSTARAPSSSRCRTVASATTRGTTSGATPVSARAGPCPTAFPSRTDSSRSASSALAESVTYPSDFLRRTFADLFPELDPATQLVLEPAPPRPQRLPPKALHSDGELRVAFVGSFHVHKGARVFLDLARTTREIDGRRIRWYILGGGDPTLLREARALPDVTIRGYYRAGTLSALLRTLGIDVALLLSVWPETYGITLDECQHAGVAIACTAAGAMAERYTGASGPALSLLARLRAEA